MLNSAHPQLAAVAFLGIRATSPTGSPAAQQEGRFLCTPVQAPNAAGNQMAELHGPQSSFYLPDLFGFTHHASRCDTGAHSHHLFLHADSCSYFLIPSLQTVIRESFNGNRHGVVHICTVAVFTLTWVSAAVLCRWVALFFLSFNKNVGWRRCGQHYIWWDNSSSHSGWKGLYKIGSCSQSSRYENRYLLEIFLS